MEQKINHCLIEWNIFEIDFVEDETMVIEGGGGEITRMRARERNSVDNRRRIVGLIWLGKKARRCRADDEILHAVVDNLKGGQREEKRGGEIASERSGGFGF